MRKCEVCKVISDVVEERIDPYLEDVEQVMKFLCILCYEKLERDIEGNLK